MTKDKERREKRLHVPMTDSERDNIRRKAEAHGLTVASYMRSAALGMEPPARRAGVDAEAVASLNRIGSNLNQIAKVCNAKGALNPGQLKALGAVLAQVRQASDRIGEAVA